MRDGELAHNAAIISNKRGNSGSSRWTTASRNGSWSLSLFGLCRLWSKGRKRERRGQRERDRL